LSPSQFRGAKDILHEMIHNTIYTERKMNTKKISVFGNHVSFQNQVEFLKKDPIQILFLEFKKGEEYLSYWKAGIDKYGNKQWSKMVKYFAKLENETGYSL